MSYATFLENKRREVPNVGRPVDPSEIHETMFGFQREIVQWACAKGRAAIFADTGLGKTRMQVEWARLIADRTLILAPLSVARQTVRDAKRIGVDVKYVRHPEEVGDGPGEWTTNYEMAEHFDPAMFDAVVLDESSILKNVTGSTRLALTKQWANTPYRLACTATPAPNDVAELCNHAEFLGVMPRNEMLAAYFVHDDEGWRLKGHAADSMYEWMAEWSVALRRPSDIGHPEEDGLYDLPPLNIFGHIVDVTLQPEGQLFATELGGVSGRHQIRRNTLEARVDEAIELALKPGQWLVWCGLNPEAEAMAEGIDGAVNMQGSWTPDAKAEAIEAFQDGEIRVLVTKPSVAAYGLNFQNCHQMIFLGLSDSYEQYYQAIRRCYRFGQKKPVDVHVVVSELEQQIVANVKRKEATASEAISALISHQRIGK